MKALDYKVIHSGSTGNAVRIENIMFDCGVPYKDMKEELYKCKFLFITHKHTDHLKIATFKKIKTNHRNIKVIANYDVASKIHVDFILGDDPAPIKTKTFELQAFPVVHDVVTHGATITFKDKKVIYVTDSAGTDTWLEGKYDYLFIESNHDETIINNVKKSQYGYDVLSAAKRHTSKQQSKAFYYLNRKSPDSEWIELHQSGRFYR